MFLKKGLQRAQKKMLLRDIKNNHIPSTSLGTHKQCFKNSFLLLNRQSTYSPPLSTLPLHLGTALSVASGRYFPAKKQTKKSIWFPSYGGMCKLPHRICTRARPYLHCNKHHLLMHHACRQY